MKFKYNPDRIEERDIKAVVHLLDDGPEECLAIKAKCGNFVWFYEDGDITVQETGWDLKDNPQKIFYEGDSVTITF